MYFVTYPRDALGVIPEKDKMHTTSLNFLPTSADDKQPFTLYSIFQLLITYTQRILHNFKRPFEKIQILSHILSSCPSASDIRTGKIR